jgi:hypothetical protein
MNLAVYEYIASSFVYCASWLLTGERIIHALSKALHGAFKVGFFNPKLEAGPCFIDSIGQPLLFLVVLIEIYVDAICCPVIIDIAQPLARSFEHFNGGV